MGWNDSPKDNDPWRGKQQPPDIDEAIKRLIQKIKKWMAQQSNKNSSPLSSTSSESFAKKAKSGFSGGVFKNGSNPKQLFGLLGGGAFLLWLLAGIFIVNPAEQAVILQFGRYVETVGAGPHWIPMFVRNKKIVNVDRVADYSYSGQMLTKDENLVSVAVAVQYRIGDLQDYLFNVSNPQESLQQATSSALRQVVGTTTLDQLITEGREAWGNRLQETLVKILSIYKTGIDVINVSPQPARAPENVQDAFDDAIKAQEDEKRFKEQARAYEAKVVPIAEGNAKRIMAEARAYAEQVVLRAKGETALFSALLPAYTQAPAITAERLYLDAMQEVLSHSKTVIMETGGANMVYLPWDKLGQIKQEKAEKSNGLHVPMLDSTLGSSIDKNQTDDGRLNARVTERLGRGES